VHGDRQAEDENDMTVFGRSVSSFARLLVLIVVWPLLGFLIITFDELGPALVTSVAAGMPGKGTFALPAGSELYSFLQWGLLTPFVVQLALRFPLMDRTVRNIAIQVVAAIVLCGFRLINEPDYALVIAQVPASQYLARAISRDLVIYTSIVVAAHLYVLARRRSAAEREALVAQANLAEAERILLEQTVSPDLIIRSLDEIARRIRYEPTRAEPLIELFGEFLRSRIPPPPGYDPHEQPSTRSAELLGRELGQAP
jgi:hypothetical protein